MWGRLDGASRLVDVLLDPWAIRLELESPDAPERMTEQLLAIAGGERPRRCGRHPRRARRARTLAARQRSADAARSERAPRCAADCSSSSPGTSFRRSPALRATTPSGTAPLPTRWGCRGRRPCRTPPRRATQTSRARSRGCRCRRGSRSRPRSDRTCSPGTSRRSPPSRRPPSPRRTAACRRSCGSCHARVRGLLLPFYGLTWGLTSKRPAWRVATLLAIVLAAAVVVWGVLADVDAREAAGGTPSGDGTLDQPPGWLHAVAVGVLVASLALGVLRGGWAGIVVAVGFGARLPRPRPHTGARRRLGRGRPALAVRAGPRRGNGAPRGGNHRELRRAAARRREPALADTPHASRRRRRRRRLPRRGSRVPARALTYSVSNSS